MEKLFNFSTILMLLACSTGVQKSNVTDVELKTKSDALEASIEKAKSTQVDLLSQKEFAKAENYFSVAKKEMAKGENDDAMEAFAESTKMLEMALSNASARVTTTPLLLEARKFAVKNKVHNYENIHAKLKEIDKDLIDETENFTKDNLTPKVFSKIENRYLDVEVMTVQANYLTDARAKLENAKKEDAAEISPETLRDATIKILNAENQISRNPRNPKNFMKSVEAANYQSILLQDVVKTIHTNGKKGTSEKVALQLVAQSRKLGALSGELTNTKSSLTDAGETLAAKNEQMATAKRQIDFQKTMDRVQNEFNPNEAEVYQQGDRLVIRLKDLKFENGQYIIPERSLPLLGKVTDIIKSLGPTGIEVQGHTDSTGSSDMNTKLSYERASAVASLLVKDENVDKELISQKGLGDSSPVASNKTEEGRATNRRVDIVLTKKIDL